MNSARGNTPKRIVIIAGPTAVGKTAVAIQLAQHFNTSIISADSRQCFRELNIGVARPSVTELQSVPHYFVASHSIHDEVTANTFEQYALEHAARLFNEHDTVIMVGGTGLYIKAFCEGLDLIPTIDPSIREKIITRYDAEGLPWLQQVVKDQDPEFYRSAEIQNPQRLMRALEVMEGTGKSILYFRNGKKQKRDFEIIKIGLDLPRPELIQRIDTRVDQMIASGLPDEVKQLVPYRNLNALRTVGYTELFRYMDRELSLDAAIEQIKINTRQYAKRQLTWFKKDASFQWFLPSESKGIIDLLT